MGTAIFMVLMVCGYWYTSRDLSTRFKFMRTSGWDVYFLVALYGCIFVLQGIIATGLLWLALLGVSSVLNAFPAWSGSDDYHYQMAFMNWSFLGIQAPVVLMLGFAILFCLYRANWSPTAKLDNTGRRTLYRTLSRANGIEGLLYECMEEGELIWITMKSQRVYIGMIHNATFDSTRSDISNLVLIPMLSGYRDHETLDLRVEHNYSAWYDSHDITLQAGEKSALAYRKVILLNQIESLSLFDPAQSLALGMRDT
ncbi:hypothetical protein R2305_002482 [Cronobacter malonaticus]|nr:hypothetical protein [Cronobacter malonaticus]